MSERPTESENTMKNNNDDFFVILTVILVAPLLLGAFLKPVRTFLLNTHILVDQAVLIPFGDGIGLDLPRILIAAAVLGILITLAVITYRAHARRKAEAGK